MFEGDFVPGVITSSTKAKPGTGFDVFPFPRPSQSSGANGVEIGGDLFVTFRDTPAIEAFVSSSPPRLRPRRGRSWAASRPATTRCPRASIRTRSPAPTALAVAQAKSVVFDMSDEQPASFGATTGQGEWGIFRTSSGTRATHPASPRSWRRPPRPHTRNAESASVAPTCRGPPANPSGRRARRGSRAAGGSRRDRRKAATAERHLERRRSRAAFRWSRRARLLRAPTSSPGKTCSRRGPQEGVFGAPTADSAQTQERLRPPPGHRASRSRSVSNVPAADRGGELDDAPRLARLKPSGLSVSGARPASRAEPGRHEGRPRPCRSVRHGEPVEQADTDREGELLTGDRVDDALEQRRKPRRLQAAEARGQRAQERVALGEAVEG